MGHWHDECGTGEYEELQLEWGPFILAQRRGRGRGHPMGTGRGSYQWNDPAPGRGRGQGRTDGNQADKGDELCNNMNQNLREPDDMDHDALEKNDMIPSVDGLGRQQS